MTWRATKFLGCCWQFLNGGNIYETVQLPFCCLSAQHSLSLSAPFVGHRKPESYQSSDVRYVMILAHRGCFSCATPVVCAALQIIACRQLHPLELYHPPTLQCHWAKTICPSFMASKKESFLSHVTHAPDGRACGLPVTLRDVYRRTFKVDTGVLLSCSAVSSNTAGHFFDRP